MPAPSIAIISTLLICDDVVLSSHGQTLQAPFSKISVGSVATEVLESVNPAWGDYDGDGYLDLFVGNFDSRNSLFHNDGGGSFTRITTGPVASFSPNEPHTATWADYDNDGLLDLMVGQLHRSANPLFRNMGAGTFALMSAEQAGDIGASAATSVSLSWADYDGDGLLDLFVANGAIARAEQDFLYHNEGAGEFKLVTTTQLTALAQHSSQGSWADFDNDGDLDLLVTHWGDGPNSLFLNDGNGQFTEVTQLVGLGETGYSSGAAWGDFDNDGDLDLIITNFRLNGALQKNYLYRNEGNATFTRISDGPIPADTGYFLSCAWIDYDNDGWLDLFLTADTESGGKNRLYHNDGNGNFTRVLQGSLVNDIANHGGCSWGDYDNDGFLDVIVANGTIYGQQKNGLYHNDGNNNSWIKLKCTGTTSNRSAIGTKVRATATINGQARTQTRQIVGSEGWVSFNALDVVIGLGDATNIDLLRIEWPSGVVQEFKNLAVKKTFSLAEGAVLKADPQPLEAPFTRVSSGQIVTEVFTSEAAASGDYNNDGWLDILVGHIADVPPNPISLFLNNKDGTFSKVNPAPLKSAVIGGVHAAAWADFDNDGFLDFTVADFFAGTSPILRNDGEQSFVQLSSDISGGLAAPAGATSVGWADYDADGHLDLFVGNGAFLGRTHDFLYHNEGGHFTNAENLITAAVQSTTQGAWADYDNDGDIDLLVTHYEQEGNTLFRNDGNGNFADVSAAAGFNELGKSVGAAWGDFDNDGDLDVIITNYPKVAEPRAANFLYRNEGNGTFTRLTQGVIPEEKAHFLSCAWIDYDNDGWLDLFLTATADPKGTNYLYRNLGDGNFAKVIKGALVTDRANTAGCSWGDYNNDGFLDVFLANGGLSGAQVNALYFNKTNNNSWIKIRCTGTRSNRSAIGTKVRVKATIGGQERWQMRQIVGSEGWLSFNALDVLIGLGDATVLETLRIEWPSGLVQEFNNVPVKQTLNITEGSPIDAGGPTLTINRSPTGVHLSWNVDDYLLQSAFDLNGPVWNEVSGVTNRSYDVPVKSSAFFRLKHR
jgi:hypothetical protein